MTQDPLQDFFEWRYHVREFYSGMIMYTLPEHPLSLDFCDSSQTTQDTTFLNLSLGIGGPRSEEYGVSYCRAAFPNRRSPQYSAKVANPIWGSFSHVKSSRFQGSLTASTCSKNSHLTVATRSSLHFETKTSKTSADLQDQHVIQLKYANSDYVTSYFTTIDGSIGIYRPDSSHISTISSFSRPITDFSPSPFDNNRLVAVCGKASFSAIDIREGSSPTKIKQTDNILSIAYSTCLPFTMAFGTAKGDLVLIDERNPSHTIMGENVHGQAVTSLKWSPILPEVLASASLDTGVVLSYMNTDSYDGLEVIFSHDGHISPISCFDWSPDIPWTLASVSEDNLLEIFTISNTQLTDYQ